MKSLISCVSIVIILFLSACSKSGDALPRDTYALLTGIRWEIVSVISKAGPAAPETDIFPAVPAFQRDDYLIFSMDSTYELNDSELLRNDTAIRIIDAGRWHIEKNGNDEYLHMISNTFTTDYHPGKITLLNDNSLEIERHNPSDQSLIRTRYRGAR